VLTVLLNSNQQTSVDSLINIFCQWQPWCFCCESSL